MGARFIMLTHFSQRYPKIPVFDDSNKNVAIAFDLMQISPHDITHFHRIVPALRALYEDLERRESSDSEIEKTTIEGSNKRKAPTPASSLGQGKRAKKNTD